MRVFDLKQILINFAGKLFWRPTCFSSKITQFLAIFDLSDNGFLFGSKIPKWKPIWRPIFSLNPSQLAWRHRGMFLPQIQGSNVFVQKKFRWNFFRKHFFAHEIEIYRKLNLTINLVTAPNPDLLKFCVSRLPCQKVDIDLRFFP